MVQIINEEIQINNGNNTRGDMNLKIITVIISPNEQWKLEREDYLVHERR